MPKNKPESFEGLVEKGNSNVQNSQLVKQDSAETQNKDIQKSLMSSTAVRNGNSAKNAKNAPLKSLCRLDDTGSAYTMIEMIEKRKKATQCKKGLIVKPSLFLAFSKFTSKQCTDVTILQVLQIA